MTALKCLPFPGRAERGVPTSFKTGLEWENLKGNMTNDWKMGRNFSDNFTVDRGGCLANFRGTQTNCRRSKNTFYKFKILIR